jgi:hypothetical protein
VCDQVRDSDGKPQVGRLNTEGLKRHFLLARHEELVQVDENLVTALNELREVVTGS